MPIFEYAGRDNKGMPTTGEIDAPSQKYAFSRLLERGIIVLHIREKVTPRTNFILRVFGPIFLRVNRASLMVFFRQFSALLHAGLSLSQCLDSISRNPPSRRLKKLALRMRDYVAKGGKLSDIMSRYPYIFDGLQIALVKSGEDSGKLETMLSKAAEYLERENSLRQLLRRITFYPKLVLIFSAVVAAKFANIKIITDYFVVIAAAALGMWIFILIGSQFLGFRRVFDSVKLAVPFLGGAVRVLAASRFANALAMMYSSGASPTVSVAIAAKASGNSIIESKILSVSDKLDSGATFSEVLSDANVLPKVVINMLAAGEETGAIDDTMARVRDYLELEGHAKMEQIGWAIAILFYLAVAAIVASIAVHFYGNIYGRITSG